MKKILDIGERVVTIDPITHGLTAHLNHVFECKKCMVHGVLCKEGSRLYAEITVGELKKWLLVAGEEQRKKGLKEQTQKTKEQVKKVSNGGGGIMDKPVTLETIARVCYEANRAWSETQGDIGASTWEQASSWRKDDAIYGVRFFRDNPLAKAEALFEKWVKEMESTGWKYGAKEDYARLENPHMVPFLCLPLKHQAKAHLYKRIVEALLPFIENGGE